MCNMYKVTGSSPRVGSNQARSELTVILKPWKEREDVTLDEIMEAIREELSQYPESKVFLSTPPVIPGLGTSGGFEMELEARGTLRLPIWNGLPIHFFIMLRNGKSFRAYLLLCSRRTCSCISMWTG